jgi:hypothetical protein
LGLVIQKDVIPKEDEAGEKRKRKRKEKKPISGE